MTNRFIKYLLLGVLTIVTPYMTTMILIIVTGDRIEGMKLGAIPGLILPHLIFGLTFIKKQLTIKFLLTTLVTATIYGLLIVTIRLKIIKTNFDIYGFWDLAVTNFIVGLIVWETLYHVNRVITTKRRVTAK
jgi:hypothetical protein